MKRILLITGLAAFISCNESSKTAETDTDSTNVTAHETTSDNTAHSMDTTTMSGMSMMTIMQKNMDQMKAMPSTGSPDNDFASMMKTHHMGAVEMVQLELAKGTNTEMKQMAQKMLDEQQKEVAELNSFLSAHDAHGGGETFHKEVMSQMNNMKMDMDHSGSIDKQFAQMMIPHHQGAIDMSNAYLKSGAHEEKLKNMAKKIISDQQKEIEELQAWLKKNN